MVSFQTVKTPTIPEETEKPSFISRERFLKWSDIDEQVPTAGEFSEEGLVARYSKKDDLDKSENHVHFVEKIPECV